MQEFFLDLFHIVSKINSKLSKRRETFPYKTGISCSLLIYNEIKKLLRAKNFNWEENSEVHLFELCTWQIVARLGKA